MLHFILDALLLSLLSYLAGIGEAFQLKMQCYIHLLHGKYIFVQLIPVKAAVLMDGIVTVIMLLYSRIYQEDISQLLH